MTPIEFKQEERVCQGDIIKNVTYRKNLLNDIKEFKYKFSYSLVLSQDCDLQWDYCSQNEEYKSSSKLLSILVVPLHKYLEFMRGVHLEEFGWSMTTIFDKESSTVSKILRQNQNPRYHY
ncbi:MAG: hypothetical protein LBT38_12540 [Deltaproteobacteria bacterium]|jgi:hypothetical protein|nr:hypothetical protein [Deltaproteobacteria bacterium]